jgi:hypothetical protein
MRGLLTDEKREQVDKTIPAIDDRISLAILQTFVTGMHDFVNEAKLGVALACLSDARGRFTQVQLALFEAQACLLWYRELSPNAPLNFQAVSGCKFYLDYVTLLLYATAEDLSYFIVYFLDLESTLAEFLEDPAIARAVAKKKLSSNAGKVGFFLNKRMPDHPITTAIMRLHKNPSWRTAIDYRNTWVHDKPPIIAGLGIEFARQKHLIIGNDGKQCLAIGGGTEPWFTIDELLATVLEAAKVLAGTISRIAEIVIEEREGLGEVFNFEASSVGMRQRGET